VAGLTERICARWIGNEKRADAEGQRLGWCHRSGVLITALQGAGIAGGEAMRGSGAFEWRAGLAGAFWTSLWEGKREAVEEGVGTWRRNFAGGCGSMR